MVEGGEGQLHLFYAGKSNNYKRHFYNCSLSYNYRVKSSYKVIFSPSHTSQAATFPGPESPRIILQCYNGAMNNINVWFLPAQVSPQCQAGPLLTTRGNECEPRGNKETTKTKLLRIATQS